MSQLPASHRTLALDTLPSFVLVLALVLTLSFLALLFGMRFGVQAEQMLRHPNPFASYELLWPGQPATNLAALSPRMPAGYRTCTDTASSGDPLVSLSFFEAITWNTFCINRSQEGVFRGINVITDKGQIQQLRLFSDRLQQDELMLYWGAPDAIRRADSSDYLWELYWERRTYTATATVMTGSIVSVVTLVTKL